jgi:hypothetical protein
MDAGLEGGSDGSPGTWAYEGAGQEILLSTHRSPKLRWLEGLPARPSEAPTKLPVPAHRPSLCDGGEPPSTPRSHAPV